MTVTTKPQTIRIGHSPDPDDAFMWYPLSRPDQGHVGTAGESPSAYIDTRGFQFEHVIEDIQTLNERSEHAELEVTALSIHQYAFVADKYALTSCGSSMGDGYGPMVVVPSDSPVRTVAQMLQRVRSDTGRPWRVAIPGRRTTAFLTLQLLLDGEGRGGVEYEPIPFDEIIPAVTAGRYDAGLIIHEGQLTYGDAGLECVVDLGRWWGDTRGLPLPLGGNAIRRDLGDQAPLVCGVLARSIQYALEHREEALEYALRYARGLRTKLADDFVNMYVNNWTIDYGVRGREAVRQLLTESAAAGLTPDCGHLDLIEPADV